MVGYGGMLLEALVAVLALATLMIAAPGDIAGLAPGAIYGQGLGRFVAVLIGEEYLVFAVTFGAMAFSTFVFDTIDVAARLGRHLLQEIFGLRGPAGATVATLATCLVAGVFLLASGPNAYVVFWTLFGTSNQLLAALSLLAVSVWLRRTGRRYGFVLAPMMFVLAATLTSLAFIIREGFVNVTLATSMNAAVAVLLLVLAITILLGGLEKLRPAGIGSRPAGAAQP
jgi:carbon starvation protein